ncbi:hypothetical protein [Priestia aryabhattai]|uniref:hypothetical protein n=1 Tax=Priestia aryabhattai TaxID=412384 RepID=UPI003C984E90
MQQQLITAEFKRLLGGLELPHELVQGELTLEHVLNYAQEQSLLSGEQHEHLLNCLLNLTTTNE